MESEMQQRNLMIRLAVALAQGLALYLLLEADRGKTWPATVPMLQTALIFVFVSTPFILLQGIGSVRLPRLLIWQGVAAAVAGGLGAYSVWRTGAAPSHVWSAYSFVLTIFLSLGLIIAHALVTGGDIDQRFRASYTTHFDVAWKLALQLLLVMFFQLAFWALLWLGALLFNLIGIGFLQTLITSRIFFIPVSALVVAGGFHLTDVQPGLVRGMRTLLLALFSWLLPLMALLATGFLLALLSTGLEPLWRMRYASGELLAASAVLIILINAMYQDGRSEHPPHPLLRYAGMVASVALVPLVALAGYAIALRVGQYGWTVDRIATATCVLVAGFYAVGYAVSIVLPPRPLQLIERWNFAASLLILAILICIFSPIADPARIAVNNQLARLRSGAVTPARFDFDYLKFNGQRFGEQALRQLAQSSDPITRKNAMAALAGRGSYSRRSSRTARMDRPMQIAQDIAVLPKGQSLPQSFRSQKWTGTEANRLERCAASARSSSRCEALVTDLNGDGKNEIVLTQVIGPTDRIMNALLFQQQSDGNWRHVANIGYPRCKGDLDALRSGEVKFAPSLQPDLMLGGRRVKLNWQDEKREPCGY